jgi:hypothetical protein
MAEYRSFIATWQSGQQRAIGSERRDIVEEALP